MWVLMFDIVYETCPWHTRAALLDDTGRLQSLRYDDEKVLYREGTVCLGVVRRVVESLSAAFVDIGDAVDGFLPLSKLPKDQKSVHEGQKILVRVTRGKEEDKGARLSANVIFDMPQSPIKAPCVLDRGPNALSRSLMDAGVNPVRIWVVDARFRTQVLPIVQETKVFQIDQHEDVDLLDVLDVQLEGVSEDVFNLPSGGRISIEKTKALTSIDVDSYAMNLRDRDRQIYIANLEAAEEISRLCRVLNIGGSVIVDFISMKDKASSKAVVDKMKKSFDETDSRKVEVLKMSRFGLLEFNREKRGEWLFSLLESAEFVAGEILLTLWRHKVPQACTVTARSAVLDVLKERLGGSAGLAYYGAPVSFVSDESLSVRQYTISS